MWQIPLGLALHLMCVFGLQVRNLKKENLQTEFNGRYNKISESYDKLN